MKVTFLYSEKSIFSKLAITMLHTFIKHNTIITLASIINLSTTESIFRENSTSKLFTVQKRNKMVKLISEISNMVGVLFKI